MAKTVKELKQVHEQYAINVQFWRLYQSAFEGINAIIKNGYITQHEREPDDAYKRRINGSANKVNTVEATLQYYCYNVYYGHIILVN